jgi:Rieske Fe-S protein
MDQTRREFLKTCGVLGAAGAVLSIAGTSCSLLGMAKEIGPSCPFKVDDSGKVVVNLDDYPTLTQDGATAYLKHTPYGRPIIVTHTTEQLYYALDSHCMHMGCTVGATTPTLDCPCHGSKYTLTGAVVQGPTKKPLKELPLVKNGNLLEITVA